MNYTKPEIVVLGHAVLLIEGSKSGSSDPDTVTKSGSDCEMDD